MGYPGPAQGSRGRALPIVVATGLAIGVFIGLIVVRGVGEKGKGEARASAAAEPAEAAGETTSADTQPAGVTDSGGTSSTAMDAGASPLSDAAVSAELASGAEDAAKAEVQDAAAPVTSSELVVKATLTFETIPRSAELLVDEQELPGRVYTVALDNGKALVKVEASAEGYRDYEKIFKVSGDKTIRVALRKRRSGGGKGGGGKGGRSGPGGLIDL